MLRRRRGGSEIGEPLLGHDAEVTALAFSPDGARLASADAEGTVLVWPVGVEAWKERACRMAGRPLTDEEVGALHRRRAV